MNASPEWVYLTYGPTALMTERMHTKTAALSDLARVAL